MSATVHARPARPATFDPDVLARKSYLTVDEAAFYTGYTFDAGYKNPRKAFIKQIDRIGARRLPKRHFGRRVMFWRLDLDRELKRNPDVPAEGAL